MVTIDNFATVTLPRAMCVNPNEPDYIYCGSAFANKISKINITNPLDITVYVSGIQGASAMTFDNSNNLYSGADGTITKITVDGQMSTFVNNIPNITGLCFDRVNNVLYCSRSSGAEGIFVIYQIDMNGNTTIYISTNGYNISSLTIDDTTNTLYWSTSDSISKIIKDGSNNPISYPYASIPTIVSSIFYHNNAVYCVGRENQTIYVVSDKANYTVISSGLIGNYSYILVYNQYLYVTNYPNNQIAQVTLDTIFVNNQYNKVTDDLPFSLNAISAYPQDIDYTSSNPSIASVDPSADIVTIQGIAGTATIGLSQRINQTMVIDASSVITVTNTVNIASVLINNINQLRYLTINPNQPSLLYYSSGDNNIYTVTRTNPTIQTYATGFSQPYGITFDNSNNLYAENSSGNGYISKTTPDKVTTYFVAFGECLPLYFNPTQQLLYFGVDSCRIIYTADLYGNTTKIVSYNESTAGGTSITGDITGKYIYIKSESTIFQLVKRINSDYYDPVVSISSIPGSGGIVYVGGIVFYLAGNSIYALYPNNQSQLLFQSDLLSGARDMILNIKESNKISFYVSTSNSILNVKIYDNFTITPNITVNNTNTNTFNKDIASPPFYINSYSQSISPITYKSLNPSIATVDPSSGLVTIVNDGTCVIEALQYGYVDGTITYTDCSANITINVSNPVISVVPVFNKIVNDSNFNLNATSDSTLPINYESLNPSVAIVGMSSGIVQVNAVGQCNIKLTQSYNGRIVSTATTTINVYAQTPFGNVTAMTFDSSNSLLYVCSNNQYPYNFITINNDGSTNSLNTATTDANITCMSVAYPGPTIYVGGTFNNLSGNQNNVNVSQLKNTNIKYSNIKLSVNNSFVDDVEYDQTIGVMTTNTGIPFEISKK